MEPKQNFDFFITRACSDLTLQNVSAIGILQLYSVRLLQHVPVTGFLLAQ